MAVTNLSCRRRQDRTRPLCRLGLVRPAPAGPRKPASPMPETTTPAGSLERAGAGTAARSRCASNHGLGQLSALVLLRHRGQRHRLDLVGLALAAELQVALLADAVGRFAR